MKLRIRGNSIRLRLTKSEVNQLGSIGKVDEVVNFGPANPTFGYQLRTSTMMETAGAKFENNMLCIEVPKSEADTWINSDLVGIESVQHVGGGKSLRILVEKDYACLSPRTNEDESDVFPNPFVTGNC